MAAHTGVSTCSGARLTEASPTLGREDQTSAAEFGPPEAPGASVTVTCNSPATPRLVVTVENALALVLSLIHI